MDRSSAVSALDITLSDNISNNAWEGRVAFRKWMMGGQNELSVACLNVCTVLHVKPEKNLGGGKRLQRGGECPPVPPPPPPPPLNATLEGLVLIVPYRYLLKSCATGNVGLWHSPR